MSTQETGNAVPEQSSDESLSFAELVSLRAGAAGESTEETEDQESEESESTEEETESSEQAEEAGEEEEESDGEEDADEDESDEDEEEESQEVDLLDLSPEQIQELAKKGKSRLLKRIGQLTAEKHAIENRLASLEAKANQAPEISPESNPFRSLDSLEKIEAKRKELEKTLETTDDLLEEHEGYGPDDVIHVGDRSFTKRDIRKANKNARDAIAKFLPAQAAHLQKQAQLAQAGEHYRKLAAHEVPEIADEESELGQRYKALVSDPLVERVKQEVPELGMQIEYILAHAARSIFGKKAAKVPPGAGIKLKAKPPATPGGAGTQKPPKPKEAKIRDARAKFEESGSIEDLVAMRAQRFSNS